ALLDPSLDTRQVAAAGREIADDPGQAFAGRAVLQARQAQHSLSAAAGEVRLGNEDRQGVASLPQVYLPGERAAGGFAHESSTNLAQHCPEQGTVSAIGGGGQRFVEPRPGPDPSTLERTFHA